MVPPRGGCGRGGSAPPPASPASGAAARGEGLPNGRGLFCVPVSALGHRRTHWPHREPPTLRLGAAGCGSRQIVQRPHARPHARAGSVSGDVGCREGEKPEPAPGSSRACAETETALFRLQVGCVWLRRSGRKWGCLGNVGRAERGSEGWTPGSRSGAGGEEAERQPLTGTDRRPPVGDNPEFAGGRHIF